MQQSESMNLETQVDGAKMNDFLPLFIGEGADRDRAMGIATKLQLKVIEESEDLAPDTLHLLYDSRGLSLKQNNIAMQGDFTQMLPRLKNGRVQSEMLFKASKIKGLDDAKVAIDATAGLGEDSILIAAAGYRVELFEKNPIIAALLEDALLRAAAIPELSELVSRMHLHTEDSVSYMMRLGQDEERGDRIDLIYLDPMFPARQKSGLIKKKFQLLQQLECPEMNGDDMLAAAMRVKPTRIVVKRPLKGELLGGKKPSFSLTGKAIRYDCFVNVIS